MENKPKKLIETIDKERPQVVILINDTREMFNVKVFSKVEKARAAELINWFCEDWKELIEESDDMPF